MKAVAYLVALIYVTNVLAGLPPTTLGGQKSSLKPTTFNFKAPNNQATAIVGGGLIETGNLNLLSNPGFEHSTFDTSWTTTGTTATITAEVSNLISGNKAFKAASSAQNISLVQDSTLYAAQLAGMQGYVQMSCSNAAPNVQLCARGAGATSTTDCVTLATDGAWKQYEIPVVLSATSNGLALTGTGVTGTTICDEGYVGLISGKTPEVSQAELIGESIWAVANCNPARTNVNFGAFTDDTDCPGPTVVFSTRGVWATTDANNIEQTITGLPFGTYVAEFKLPALLSVVSNAYLTMFDGAAQCATFTNIEHEGAYEDTTIRCVYPNFQGGSKTFEIYGKSSSGSITLAGAVDANASFRLYYYPPASKIYSQQCQNNPTSCENEFSAKIGVTGTVSDENLDWINGNCSLSTSTYTCNFNSSIFTVAPNCVATSARSDAGHIVRIIAQTSSSIQVLGFSDAGSNTSGAFNITCQKQGADFKAQNVITGTFAEMMRVPGVSKPVKYRADVSSGDAVTNETTDWINGNCTDATTGEATCVFNSTAFASGSIVRCKAEGLMSSSGNAPVNCGPLSAPTSSGVTILCKQGSADLNYGFTLDCEGTAP